MRHFIALSALSISYIRNCYWPEIAIISDLLLFSHLVHNDFTEHSIAHSMLKPSTIVGHFCVQPISADRCSKDGRTLASRPSYRTYHAQQMQHTSFIMQMARDDFEKVPTDFTNNEKAESTIIFMIISASITSSLCTWRENPFQLCDLTSHARAPCNRSLVACITKGGGHRLGQISFLIELSERIVVRASRQVSIIAAAPVYLWKIIILFVLRFGCVFLFLV